MAQRTTHRRLRRTAYEEADMRASKTFHFIAITLVAATLVGIAPPALAGADESVTVAGPNLWDGTVYRPGCPFEECRSW